MSEIICGDAVTILRERFADESVQCCVTSPPYWGLRDYGTATWEGGHDGCLHRVGAQVKQTRAPYECGTGQRPGVDASQCLDCGAIRIDAQLGLEPTPEEYVAKMVEVFREVRRVLKLDGTLWLNLGDSYASDTKGSGGPDTSSTLVGTKAEHNGQRMPARKMLHGLKSKNLVGIPWRVAFALQADGWYLRSDIIWSKPNPMPESVTDRPTKAHEYLFLLAKSERYYYDAEAIAELSVYPEDDRASRADSRRGSECNQISPRFSVERGGFNGKTNELAGREAFRAIRNFRNKRTVWEIATQPYAEAHFATFPPKLIEPCILAGCPAGGLVLDPFAGSGTTLMVAKQLGRQGVGIELNPEYINMAEVRTAQQGLPL